MIQHLYQKFLSFLTGGQSDFPLPLLAKVAGVNVAPWMEVAIAVCLVGAAIFVALTIRRLLARRWVRAAISLVVAASMTTAAYAASSTLSALTAASGVNGTDMFYDVQTPGTGGVKASAAQLLAYIGANIGAYVSISAGCGNSTGAGAVAVGSINSQLVASVQTGSNYPIAISDCGKVVVLSNGSNQVPTIPQAGSTGFLAGWYTTVCNVGAGTQTLTPASGTIAGASSFVLAAGSVTAPVCIGIYSGSSVGTNDYGIITGAGATVSSVTNSDGTLTISPTTGAAVASLALGHANTWTAVQTFTNSDLKLLGSSTGATTFTSGNASATNYTLTIPAATDTVAELGQANAFTGANTHTNTETFAAVIGAIRTVSITTDTLATTDCGTDVRYTSNSAVTVTIPTTLTVGCHINVIQRGTAKVSVNGTAVSACTLTSGHSYTGTSGTAGSVVGIIMDATNTCILTGDGS